MREYSLLLGYSAVILLFSMLGGHIPFLFKFTHSRLQYYLSASAGVMLGACFFHVMPDAMDRLGGLPREEVGQFIGLWMLVGVVLLFSIERFIAPHSHEIDEGGHHQHSDHHTHGPKHDHVHLHEHGAKDQRAAAPAVAGWMAVVGLTIHTFMNGVALAGALQVEGKSAAALGGFWNLTPGLAIFLAIAFHKPADALAISTVLTRKGVSRHVITLVQLCFALMIPLGGFCFLFTEGRLDDTLKSRLTAGALAFSAGTFLLIALSDLLPEVQFHRHDRVPLFGILLVGIALMWGIAWLEGQGKEASGEDKPQGETPAGEVLRFPRCPVSSPQPCWARCSGGRGHLPSAGGA